MSKPSSLRAIALLFAVGTATGCTSMTSRYDKDMARAEVPRVYACHGFDCRRKTRVPIGAEAQMKFATIMAEGTASPEAERSAIRRAVAYYEALSTSAIGVADKPKSDITQSGALGQMDCIDESTNTRSLLRYLDARGLLKHHVVEQNKARGMFVDGRYPHATAVIRDTSGRRFAVDSWYEAGGGEPDVLPFNEWMSRGVLGAR